MYNSHQQVLTLRLQLPIVPYVCGVSQRVNCVLNIFHPTDSGVDWNFLLSYSPDGHHIVYCADHGRIGLLAAPSLKLIQLRKISCKTLPTIR